VLASELMSRNKIAANKTIFQALDEYCQQRDDPIRNAGTKRWISTKHHDRDFLVRAHVAYQLTFSASVKIARFDFSKKTYFVTFGIDNPNPPEGLVPELLTGGLLTAALSELQPRPIARASEIRNIVEFADGSDHDYKGHDPDMIAGLFPKAQVFSAASLIPEDTLKVCFLICLADRRRIEQWIDENLARTLVAIADLSTMSIPFVSLCRSLLDMDPRSLFLSLYRCLESLYAYTHTQRLMTAVGVKMDWADLAAMLEQTLGWYPREEPSLQALLDDAVLGDLRAVAAALNEAIPSSANETAFVAKKIYELRNVLVHYRPFHHKSQFGDVDWNRLCYAMTCLVWHTHQDVSAAF